MAATALPGRRTSSAPIRSIGAELVRFVPVALISTLICFAITAIAPNDTAAQLVGEGGTPAQVATLNHQLGLDRPFPVQYVTWLGHALQGNLGSSYFTHVPVATSIAQRFPVDLSIAFFALVFAVLLGFAGGLLAAVRPHGLVDRTVTLIGSFAVAVP